MFFDGQWQNDHGHGPRRRRGFVGGLGSVIIFCIVMVANVACEGSATAKPSVVVVTSSPVVQTSTSASVSVSSTVSSAGAKSDAQKKSEKHKKYVVVADKGDKSNAEGPEYWKSWVPMPQENITAEMLMPTPNTTPLTIVEQEKRLAAMNSFTNKKKQELADLIAKDKMKYQQSAAKPITPSWTDKWSLEALRDQVFSYSQMLLDNFVNGVQSSSAGKPPKGRGKPKSLPQPQDQTASGSAPVPASASPFGHYAKNVDDPIAAASSIYSAAQAILPAYTTAKNIYSNYGGEAKSVVNWLARLIGVSGKTLGEFLREYQVHVLYDLVFTFFKWIFFLYAGLLIP